MKIAPLAVALLALPACTQTSAGPSDLPCEPGATEACYSGDASTRDVGTCHAGVRTCAADGQSFGACAGEVLPAPESCTSDVDLDCNGKTADCTGAALWKLPLTGTIAMGGVAASADGESTIFGWAQTIDIGIGTGPQGDGTSNSLFVARIGTDGTPRWLHTYPGVHAATNAGAVVMSEAHEATVSVYVEGAVTVGAQSFNASPNGVLAMRFDDGGTLSAAQLVDLGSAPALLEPRAQVARLAGDGSVVVGGPGFVAGLGDKLTTLWHQRFTGDVTIADLTPAGDGSLFAVGSYQGAFEPGGGATPVTANHAGFLAQLAGSKVLWSETMGGDVETKGLTVASLGGGTLIVGGLQAGGGTLVDGNGSAGLDSTGFLGARNPSGTFSSTFFGWGGANPVVQLDTSQDAVVLVVANDEWSPHVLFKSLAYGHIGNPMIWTLTLMWPPVYTTLPSGETIVATQAGVQKLGR